MDVFLTGGTGLVGSSVLEALLASGHTVTALARSDSSAATLARPGVTIVRGELIDSDVIERAAATADATIHAASPGDATSAAVDRAVSLAVLKAHKPYVHTGGIWVFGNTDGPIEQNAPKAPPQLTAWRLEIEQDVLAGGGSILAPGVVYGRSGGLPQVLLHGPQQDGALLYPGTGDQHWVTVHTADLGRLYVLVLERASTGSYVLAGNGTSTTVRELAEAASHALGLEGKTAPEPPEQTAARLGPLAAALDLDQQTTAAAARQLGWVPLEPTLLELLAQGY